MSEQAHFFYQRDTAQINSQPTVQWGKIFDLRKFVMGTKVLPLCIPKLGNGQANLVGKVGGGERFGIDMGEL